MTHVMLDLETFGTKAGSVLRSIGAVIFDPRGEGTGDEFYYNIDRESCERIGLTVDRDTEEWWARQSREARDSLLVNPQPIGVVIMEFHSWFTRLGGEKIWCQGANFDAVLWESVCAAAQIRVPWKFWNVRDTRTVYEMFRFDPKSLPRAGTYHNALDDAKYQAECVQKAIKRYGLQIREKVPEKEEWLA